MLDLSPYRLLGVRRNRDLVVSGAHLPPELHKLRPEAFWKSKSPSQGWGFRLSGEDAKKFPPGSLVTFTPKKDGTNWLALSPQPHSEPTKKPNNTADWAELLAQTGLVSSHSLWGDFCQSADGSYSISVDGKHYPLANTSGVANIPPGERVSFLLLYREGLAFASNVHAINVPSKLGD